jgi:phosphoglucan,water dikinase
MVSVNASDGGASRIRIGNQTAFSASCVTLPFEYAVENGFDAFEWFPDKKEWGAGWTDDDISPDARARIRETARSRDILLSVHAPWQADPLSPDGLEPFSKSVQLAGDIGASIVNVHLSNSRGIEAYLEGLAVWMRILSREEIRLSIENTPLTGPEELNELFSRLPSRFPKMADRVGMCLDLGHANLCEATRNDYLGFMDRLGPHVPIVHVHAHENYGDADSHLPLFTGPAGKDSRGIEGFIQRLLQRRFSGAIILEQWPEPPTLLNTARDRLIEIIGRVSRIETPCGTSEPAFHHLKAKSNEMPPPPSPPLAEDLADFIVQADKEARSWREKLALVHGIVTDETRRLSTQDLATLAIYLRFIAASDVRLDEDGSHYRPSHHAKMALDIHDRLSRIMNSENAFVIRKIYPFLPSFDSSFTRWEPLTLIRDIAHRNDIPKELKQEIKHTLQNKLHRCAGPEDLDTSTRILKGITAPGADFSPDFVQEFMRFHEQLKEFFNARSLDEQLEAIAKKAGKKEADPIRRFLAAKKRASAAPDLIGIIETLTEVRIGFARTMPRSTSAEAQELELADIKLDEYLFVTLSRIINDIEAQPELPWPPALRSLLLQIENLRLSRFSEEECVAIASELDAWRRELDLEDSDQQLRLKATLDRSLRLAETYTSAILALFPPGVRRLGSALGVSERAIGVYAESDIRSSPVFQLSKLASLLIKNLRGLMGLSAWDTIASGKAIGRLVSVSKIDDGPMTSEQPSILLLAKVDGDEEIPPHVAGMVISHPIPHLSHLAVRARAAGIVLAVVEDPIVLGKLAELSGKTIVLEAGAEGVSFEACPEPAENSPVSDRRATMGGGISPPEVVMSPGLSFLPLDRASVETSGSKAASAGKLEALSRNEEAGFKTPPGFVIPFGVMEESLRMNPEHDKEHRSLQEALSRSKDDADLEHLLRQMRELIGALDVPREIVRQAKAKFPEVSSWMVRSSANIEDLPGFPAAGLYDSIADVQTDSMAEAVRSVWKSLWTKRAVLSRKNMGIPHQSAHMAVLVQQIVVPELSFIIHTVNPVNSAKDEVYIELAVGLGQTLASGDVPGVPYRMIGNKRTGDLRMLSFASFSRAVFPGRHSESEPPSLSLSLSCLDSRTIDYSKIGLSRDRSVRQQLGARLSGVAVFIENALGQPQDIEGAVTDDGSIFVLQSRPQQGMV